MLSAIMSSPDFGEICFLVALIVFIIAAVAAYARRTVADVVYVSVALIAIGFCFLSLGFLAL